MRGVSSDSAEQGDAAAPTTEELVAELRKAKVGDFLVQTCSLLASLAYGKLTEEARDLDDVRLAIDSLRALHPLLPQEAAAEVQNVMASLQLAYASASADPQAPAPEAPR
jgi:hypothetical protein